MPARSSASRLQKTHGSDGNRLSKQDLIALERRDLSQTRHRQLSRPLNSNKRHAKATDETKGELGKVLGSGSSLRERVGVNNLELKAFVLGGDERDARARVVGVLRSTKRKEGSESAKARTRMIGLLWRVMPGF